MKNIALIKSIVATSISSANPAELTEHIAALIQAHPEETREKSEIDFFFFLPKYLNII